MDERRPDRIDRNPAAAARDRAARRTAAACIAGIAFMGAAAFAAVPLYDLFCKATGFGGTPRVAAVAPVPSSETSGKLYTVRFDSNVAPGLTWRFEPEQPTVKVHLGQTVTVFYKITNTGPRPSTGIASFNVVPEQTGGYFNKIQCFCFNEITLEPGESMEAPVVFFLDPKMGTERDLQSIETITLSYTFFVPKGSPKPLAEAKDDGRPKL